MLDHLSIQCSERTARGFRESHIAFLAPSREAVQAFFGACVRDPDGNNVEAVCHVRE